MAIMFPDTQANECVRYIRQEPRTTQQVCDHMGLEYKLRVLETEELLYELRDERRVAYANGAWYDPTATRHVRKPATKEAHPRQTNFFDPDAGMKGPEWYAQKRKEARK